MVDNAKTEIEDMLAGLGTPVDEPPVEPPVEPPIEPSIEEPPLEEPPVEPPIEESPVVEPPVAEPPVEEPPIVEPPAVEPPVEETADQRAVRLEAQNTALLERIETLSGAPAPAAPAAAPAPVPGTPPVQPVPAAPSTEIVVEDVDFLQGRTPDDLVDNPAEFNKMLNAVYRKGIEAGVPLAMERSLLAVPQVVVSQIQRSNVMKGLVDDFYKANEDLKSVQRTVGMVANEIYSEHPDWTVKQVFDEAAPRTRKVLGISGKPVAAPAAPVAPVPGVVVTPKPGDPAFANVSGSRQRGPAAPKLTGMAKEIDELM